MASNGFMKRAKKGKCHICFRVRKVDEQVFPVGEVNHGYAVGYIWECKDHDDCDRAAKEKLERLNPDSLAYMQVKIGVETGRYTTYQNRS